ncbi:MAG: hypothetical protein Q4D62_12775 [Planctomycetia bacterium]|nr:hypothetical protein [Planctomycetia bacterium]
MLFGVWMALNAFAEIDQELKNAILNATDDTVLIETISKPGNSPDDIFMKGLACKRLAVIGSEKALPALSAMLPDAKLSHYARYALEAMPGEKVDAVLLQAAKELTGMPAVGVVDTLGARKMTAAVGLLKEKLAANPDPVMKKAIYAALGYIANDEAAAILLAELKGTPDTNDKVWAGLADALLDCGEAYEAAGNLAKAMEIYDATVHPSFPVYAQKAAAYHGLLVRKSAACELLLSKMFSDKECCFTGGLKTIREYAAEDGEAITKAIIGALDKLPPERKALVILALRDRTDAASKNLFFPVAISLTKDANVEVQVAAIRALGKVGAGRCGEVVDALNTSTPRENPEERQAVLDAMVQTVVALPCKVVNEKWLARWDGLPLNEVDVACAYFKVIELRRIAAAGPKLVAVANQAGLDAKVRDAALAALSEIVTLDNLNLLVDALNGEKDDGKVSWILRAACTRLPREDCAAEVVKMFNAATDAEAKGKLLTLLKQIGGKTALACVEKACWDDATVDAATQVLGTWNTPDDILDVAAACLKLAKESKEERYAVRGIRSYIRVPRQFDLPKETKFEMCRIAFETAKRPEDKMLIFEVFKRVIDVASAKAAMSYAADPAYRDAACAACVAVAMKFQGVSNELKALLNRVVAECQDAKTVADAKTVLNRLDAALKDAPYEIVSAKYGAGDSWKNVTAIVVAKFTGKADLGLVGNNQTFGDSAPGKVKTTQIVIKCKKSGQNRTLEFKENQPLVLPAE